MSVTTVDSLIWVLKKFPADIILSLFLHKNWTGLILLAPTVCVPCVEFLLVQNIIIIAFLPRRPLILIGYQRYILIIFVQSPSLIYCILPVIVFGASTLHINLSNGTQHKSFLAAHWSMRVHKLYQDISLFMVNLFNQCSPPKWAILTGNKLHDFNVRNLICQHISKNVNVPQQLHHHLPSCR